MPGNILTFPPGSVVSPHTHPLSDLTQLNFARVANVASSGAEFTSAQTAIDSVNSGLSESAQAAVFVYLLELPEDIEIPKFVHVVAMGFSKITGSMGNQSDAMVAMDCCSSLRGFRLENQDDKDVGIELFGGSGTDIRALENITITNLVTGKALAEGIVVQSSAGVDVIAFNRVDVLLSTAGTCIRKETANVELFTFGCNFTIFSGGGAAIKHNNGRWLSFSDCMSGPIILTSPGVFEPSGTNYDKDAVSGTGTVKAVTPAESLTYSNTISGMIATDVQKAIDEAYGSLHTVDPTVAADQPSGFEVGHTWINTVNRKIFKLLDSTFSAADWDEITPQAAVFAQLSSSVDQIPGSTTPEVITYNTQDAIQGLTHSTTVNPGEITIPAGNQGKFVITAQPQVAKDSGGIKIEFNVFIQKDTGGGFVNVPDSNAKLTIKDSDITDVLILIDILDLAVGDKIRVMQAVSATGSGIGLHKTDLQGSPSIPATPSIIFAMHRSGI